MPWRITRLQIVTCSIHDTRIPFPYLGRVFGSTGTHGPVLMVYQTDGPDGQQTNPSGGLAKRIVLKDHHTDGLNYLSFGWS
jgi:hypothetical protein